MSPPTAGTKLNTCRSPGVWGEPRAARQLSPVGFSLFRLQYRHSYNPGYQRPNGPAHHSSDYSDDQRIDHLNVLSTTQQRANDTRNRDNNHHDQRLYGGPPVLLHLLVSASIQSGRAQHSAYHLVTSLQAVYGPEKSCRGMPPHACDIVSHRNTTKNADRHPTQRVPVAAAKYTYGDGIPSPPRLTEEYCFPPQSQPRLRLRPRPRHRHAPRRTLPQTQKRGRSIPPPPRTLRVNVSSPAVDIPELLRCS